MLIVLYGPDSYRRIRKLNEIIEAHRKKEGGLSFERFDLSLEASASRLRDFLGTPSIFGGARLVVLDNLLYSLSEKEIKDLLKKYADAKDTMIVVNLEKKPPVAYKFLLEKAGEKLEFSALSGKELTAFIKQTAADYGRALDAQTVRFLSEAYKGDSWGVVTELERMAFTEKGEVEMRLAIDYYGLIRVLKYSRGARNRVPVLEQLLLDYRNDPARVFNTVAYNLRNAREAEEFANYDVLVKSGKLDYEEALLDLALR